ncbi:MAG TPA: hypothetical protein VGU02_08730 [Gaiellaceae bacterium]|nr:hypothetical protein [Gaiellaceae bacterium]
MLTAVKKAAAALVGVAALAIGGSAIANADSGGGTTTTTTPPSMPAHGSASHEDAEQPVTGTNADKAKAAAIKSLGGGTAGDVTTDFTQNGYEVTVTKSDGSEIEVHLDSSFNVMQRPGGHGAPPPGPPPSFG